MGPLKNQRKRLVPAWAAMSEISSKAENGGDR
jgi:hypothetical protein